MSEKSSSGLSALSCSTGSGPPPAGSASTPSSAGDSSSKKRPNLGKTGVTPPAKHSQLPPQPQIGAAGGQLQPGVIHRASTSSDVTTQKIPENTGVIHQSYSKAAATGVIHQQPKPHLPPVPSNLDTEQEMEDDDTLASGQDVIIPDDLVDKYNDGNMDIASIQAAVNDIDKDRRLGYTKKTKFPHEIFVYRGENREELFTKPQWETFINAFAPVMAAEELSTDEGRTELTCHGQFLSAGQGRFLCVDEKTKEWMKKAINNLTVDGDSFRAVGRNEPGASWRLTFSIKCPIGLDDDLMQRTINAKNKLNGGLKIIESFIENFSDKDGNPVHYKRYIVRVSSNSIDQLRTKSGLFLCVQARRPVRLHLAKNHRERAREKARRLASASMIPAAPGTRVSGKGADASNSLKPRVISAKWALPVDRAFFWNRNKKERKEILAAYRAQGLKHDFGSRPPKAAENSRALKMPGQKRGNTSGAPNQAAKLAARAAQTAKAAEEAKLALAALEARRKGDAAGAVVSEDAAGASKSWAEQREALEGGGPAASGQDITMQEPGLASGNQTGDAQMQVVDNVYTMME